MSPEAAGEFLTSVRTSFKSLSKLSMFLAVGICTRISTHIYSAMHELTVTAKCNAAGSANAFKCHPFLPIASPTA